MIESPGWTFTVLAFLVVIGPLIFVHELGHYLVGRWFGVKADVFSLGFGRQIFGWTDRQGTLWKVGWLPLGGYVKFAGDTNPASTPSKEWLSLPAEERSRTFQAKPLWQRFLIVAAGPVTNFLFAILLFSALFGFWGVPTTQPIIGKVDAGSGAAAAGLQVGDRIVSVNGQRIERFEEIFPITAIRPNKQLSVVIVRGERQLKLTATTKLERFDHFGNQINRGVLGIRPLVGKLERLPPHEIVGTAVAQTGQTVRMIAETLAQLVIGDRSVRELGGPLKVAQISGQQASLGVTELLWFMALISINLGFINLLPVPMLDGGHLLFYTIEGVRRKPLKPEAQEWAFKAGLAALLTLMIFVTLNDLVSFGVLNRLAG